MLKRVARAIDPRSFSVPDTEYAVDGLVRVRFYLLGAEYRGGREIFVDRREKFDIALGEERFRTPEFEVDHAERRATITADKARGIEPGGNVHRALHQPDSNQCLGTSEEDSPGFAAITVDKFVVIEHSGTVSSKVPVIGSQSSRKTPSNSVCYAEIGEKRDSIDA